MNTKKVVEDIGFEIISTSPKNARKAIGCGNTRFYELINSGEIQSYTDGRSRKILVASLRDYVARQVEAEASKERMGWTDKATKARVRRRRAISPTGV